MKQIEASSLFVATVQQLAIDSLANEDGIPRENLRLYAQFTAETFTRALRLDLRCPGHVLRDRSEVYREPKNLWHLILHYCGGRRWAKYEVTRVSEIVLFPQVPVPDELFLGHKIFFKRTEQLEPYDGKNKG